ncbi:hypothetical protein [Nocardia jinanensis]|uniref:Uncharacterized protein n=1 Tax=Nocardia jinanensis TaxID=382504 RepID=A0A917RKR7_9NOCA|nr:hypothetical protein [Nocardia jinanensis]GGL11509.1 hypothetical protein GCM10011588_27480 [Nocardia jinanensis]
MRRIGTESNQALGAVAGGRYGREDGGAAVGLPVEVQRPYVQTLTVHDADNPEQSVMVRGIGEPET